jgi:hypothetical protein
LPDRARRRQTEALRHRAFQVTETVLAREPGPANNQISMGQGA